ncbi:hypothetical protein G210_4270, partial [Candida maltosa Xu316]
MTGLQLSQFPLEILEIIISYLSISDLDKLDGINYLKRPVLKSFYSSVRIKAVLPPDSRWIDPSFPRKLDYLGIDERKPNFSCFNSLIAYLEQNHVPLPKYIHFESFIDIVVVHDANPNVLQDCIIQTNLDISAGSDRYSSELRKFYLEKLISLPLKFRRVGYCEELIDESSDQFTRNLTSACFNKTCLLEIAFEGNRYQNLVNLEIRFDISHEVLKYIPRQIKKLNCCILRPEFELTEFGFPSGLRSLEVSFINYPENYEVNFTDLEHLVDLEFDITHSRRKIPFYNVTFPKSLKSVTSFALDLVQVKNQCPELMHFDCLTVRHAETEANAIDFPEKVTRLRLGCGELANVEKYENDSSTKLPKNLQSLYLADGPCEVEFDESQTLFSDKEENKLQSLSSVTLFEVKEFMKFGPIPRSLTELMIYSPKNRMKSLEGDFFASLKSVTSLRLLKITCPLGSIFDYELPPNLQCFEFNNRELCKISIRSETLKCLRLYAAKFEEISPKNVQIPGSLVELSIIDCFFHSFDKSFLFPGNLQILNLDVPNVKNIPKLPSNLKTFHICYQVVNAKQSEFDKLPTTLEDLHFINTASIRIITFTPNLTHLINLKRLGFSSLSFRCSGMGLVNLDNFPKSLTDLSLDYCGIQKFMGNFMDFPNLKELSLRDNNLSDWLSSSPKEFRFGAAIRIIVLLYDRFDTDTIKNLLYELKKNPNFGFLVVSKMTIPEDVLQLVRFQYSYD